MGICAVKVKYCDHNMFVVAPSGATSVAQYFDPKYDISWETVAANTVKASAF